MSEFDILGSAAAGMEAQRAALDVAARNVAAAETVPSHAFARLVPQFAYAMPDDSSADGDIGASFSSPIDFDEAAIPVRYAGTTAERGVDVDAITEMVAVLDAQRAYEANATVFDLGKRLAERTIDLGRP